MLRDRLKVMRKGIRQYVAAKNDLPRSYDDLIKDGFIPEFVDPTTGKQDWQAIIGEDPKLLKGKRGVIDIRSRSTRTSSDGTQYSSW